MSAIGNWFKTSEFDYDRPTVLIPLDLLKQYAVGIVLSKMKVDLTILQMIPEENQAHVEFRSLDGNRSARKVALFYGEMIKHWPLKAWRTMVSIVLEDLFTIGEHLKPIHLALNRIIVLSSIQEQAHPDFKFEDIDFVPIADRLRPNYIWPRMHPGEEFGFSFMPDIDDFARRMVLELYKKCGSIFECSKCQTNAECIEHSPKFKFLKKMSLDMKRMVAERLDSYDLVTMRTLNKDFWGLANEEIYLRKNFKDGWSAKQCVFRNVDGVQKIEMLHFQPHRWPFKSATTMDYSNFYAFVRLTGIRCITISCLKHPLLLELIEASKCSELKLSYLPKEEEEFQEFNKQLEALKLVTSISFEMKLDNDEEHSEKLLKIKLDDFALDRNGVTFIRI